MIIETENLSKSFIKKNLDWRNLTLQKTEKVAVNGISIGINEGEFVGFLGPNGAGKTTFLKMLSGIMHPTSGKAQVLGFTPWQRKNEYLNQIAIVMGQKNQLWWDLPAIDSYQLLKAVYGIEDKTFKKNLSMMTDTLGMSNLLQKRLREMSLGERMKCEITACFLHNPKVVFLDEPTIGLDVISAHSIREFLKKINKERGCTLILTSHYMTDVEELCERVIVINKGDKVYDGTLNQMKLEYAPEKIIEIVFDNITEKQKFAKLKIKNKRLLDNRGVIRINKKELGETVKEIFENFDAERITITDPETEEIIAKIFNDARA